MNLKLLLLIILALYFFTPTFFEGFEGGHGGLPICVNCRKPTPFCCCKGGKWELFKKPNYYGLGTWGYHYGEPFYWRHMNA